MSEPGVARDPAALGRLLDLAPDLLCVCTLDGRLIEVGGAWERTLGYPREQLLTMGWSDFLHPEDEDRAALMLARLRAGQPVSGAAVRLLHKDGSERWVEWSASVADGLIYSAGREITERVRTVAEEGRRAALLEALVGGSPDGLLVVDSQGRQIFINERMIALWKIPRELAEDPDDARQVAWATQQTKHPEAFLAKVSHLYSRPEERSWDEVEFVDGTILERYSSPVTGVDGTHHGRIWTFRDATERKRAEGALRESEARYRRLYESIRDAHAATTMDGRLTEFNDVFLNMLGYTREELLALDYRDFTPPRWHALEARIVEEQVLARGYSDIYEKEYRRKDGTVFPVELRSFLLRDEAGAPAGMWAIVRDITRRKRDEAELRRLQARFATAFYGTPLMMTIATVAEGRYVEVNEEFERRSGYSRDEVVGRLRSEVGIWDDPAELEAVMRQLRETGSVQGMVVGCRTKFGTLRRVRISISLIDLAGERCALTAAEDITELEEAGRALRESEAKLRVLTAELENRVAERTAELARANADLQARSDELGAFNRAMLGRERRVIELKEEVNRLRAELGLPEAYAPVWREGAQA